MLGETSPTLSFNPSFQIFVLGNKFLISKSSFLINDYSFSHNILYLFYGYRTFLNLSKDIK